MVVMVASEEEKVVLVRCRKNKRRKCKQKQKQKQKQTKEEESSSSLNYFPDELLIEVFVRLPNCKSAIQGCGMVSKHWNSLISNPHMIRSFNLHNRHLDWTILIGLPDDHPIPFSIYSIQSDNKLLPSSNYFNFLPPDSNPWMVRASCDDLLLVSSYDAAASRDEQLYICNPLTKRYVALPNPDLNSKLFNCCKYGLMVAEQYNYKVVVIGKPKPKGKSMGLIAAIYCSRTLKWSTVMVKSPRVLHFYPEELYNADVIVACSNRMLHWVDVRALNYAGIFVFDPTQPEHCLYIYRPCEISRHVFIENEIFMGVCLGRLRMSFLQLTGLDRCNVSYRLRVWELGNYDNKVDSWCLKYDVHFKIGSIGTLFVLAFNPTNPDTLFLHFKDVIYECNLTNFNMEKPVGTFPYESRINYLISLKLFKCYPFTLLHPAWPTPLP